jgi:hypothetical protein
MLVPVGIPKSAVNGAYIEPVEFPNKYNGFPVVVLTNTEPVPMPAPKYCAGAEPEGAVTVVTVRTVVGDELLLLPELHASNMAVRIVATTNLTVFLVG